MLFAVMGAVALFNSAYLFFESQIYQEVYKVPYLIWGVPGHGLMVQYGLSEWLPSFIKGPTMEDYISAFLCILAIFLVGIVLMIIELRLIRASRI